MQNRIRPYVVAFSLHLRRVEVALGVAFLCAICAASARAQVPAEAPKPASKSVHVYSIAFTPLKRHGGPVVRVRLNDKIDANFLVDTGSAVSVISTGLAKKLNLSLKPYATRNDKTFPTGTKLALGLIKNLNLGGSEGEAPVLVSDTVVQVAGDKSVEGILGMNELGTFALIFNFDQNQLLLIEDGKLNDVLLKTLGAKGGVAAGITIHPTADKLNLLFTAPAFVEGKKSDLRIDSGASTTFLPMLDAKIKTRLEPKSIRYQIRGVGGFGTCTFYPLSALSVGNPALNKLSPFQIGVANAVREADANLGIDYLSHFQFILDCPAQRMYLTPIQNPANSFFPTESSRQSAVLKTDDLVLMPMTQGGWSVVAIEGKGYYGKAGIHLGDIVEQINGETTTGKLSCELGALFDKNDKAATISLIRDGKPLIITVPTK